MSNFLLRVIVSQRVELVLYGIAFIALRSFVYCNYFVELHIIFTVLYWGVYKYFSGGNYFSGAGEMFIEIHLRRRRGVYKYFSELFGAGQVSDKCRILCYLEVGLTKNSY